MVQISPLAGKPPPQDLLVDIDALVKAYYAEHPDPADPAQRVSFGTSGHRGSALARAFNEDHILAITQAICEYRNGQGISGPLFIGVDTHGLSEPALHSALEVLVAHDVDVRVEPDGKPTPTPAISHAILKHNRGAADTQADGIVVTPSHNPPEDGGFKYNPPDGGPAGTEITGWMQDRANEILAAGLTEVSRVPYERARSAVGTFDYTTSYINDLPNVVDLDAIRASGLRMGVDPLGGASVYYWQEIADRHNLPITVVNKTVDPTFRFMTVDRDGKIRMDCSSPYAMASLIRLKDDFDLACGNDTDSDRHGVVTRGSGLLNPNHYLSVAIAYLYGNRSKWPDSTAVGKTLVSSSMIDRVTDGPRTSLGRGAGRVQVVRRRAHRRHDRIRRRGERGRLVPENRRVGLDHGQGRHHPRPPGRGNHCTHRQGPRTDLPAAHRATRRPGLFAHRRAGDPGAEGPAQEAQPRPADKRRSRG